jgi:hypothetical protein
LCSPHRSLSASHHFSQARSSRPSSLRRPWLPSRVTRVVPLPSSPESLLSIPKLSIGATPLCPQIRHRPLPPQIRQLVPPSSPSSTATQATSAPGQGSATRVACLRSSQRIKGSDAHSLLRRGDAVRSSPAR